MLASGLFSLALQRMLAERRGSESAKIIITMQLASDILGDLSKLDNLEAKYWAKTREDTKMRHPNHRNGTEFVAGHVADCRQPAWARPIENDPIAMWCCGGDTTCGITDDEFRAMIADLEPDFFDF